MCVCRTFGLLPVCLWFLAFIFSCVYTTPVHNLVFFTALLLTGLLSSTSGLNVTVLHPPLWDGLVRTGQKWSECFKMLFLWRILCGRKVTAHLVKYLAKKGDICEKTQEVLLDRESYLFSSAFAQQVENKLANQMIHLVGRKHQGSSNPASEWTSRSLLFQNSRRFPAAMVFFFF